MTTEEKIALCKEVDKKLYESETSFLLAVITDEKNLCGPCAANFVNLAEFYSMIMGLFGQVAQALNTDSATLMKNFSRFMRDLHKENFKNRKKNA